MSIHSSKPFFRVMKKRFTHGPELWSVLSSGTREEMECCRDEDKECRKMQIRLPSGGSGKTRARGPWQWKDFND